MRIISRRFMALVLADTLLLLAAGCTSDEGAAVDVTATEPEISAEGDSSSEPSLADLNVNDSSPVKEEKPVDLAENTDSKPGPLEQQIPQALKDASTRKIVQQYADKTTHREFTAKVVGKSFVYHGLYTEYYQGGAKQKSGQYEYGRKNGDWTFWGKNGVVRKKGTYINDKQDGEWHKYRDDGTLEWIERYRNGLTHGTWQAYQADGKNVVWERSYKAGRRHGQWINFFADGSKGSIETYTDGKRNGPTKSWFENGQLNMEGEYVDGQRHGTFRAFDTKGGLRDEVKWENGKLKVGS